MGHSIIGMAEALVKIPIKNLHCNHNINIHLSFWRYFGWVQSKTNDSKCWYLKIGKKQSSRENELLGQSSETTKSTRMKGRRGQEIERSYNDQNNKSSQDFSRCFIVVCRPWFPRIIETWKLTWILISLNTQNDLHPILLTTSLRS